jgi:hypothetical protein
LRNHRRLICSYVCFSAASFCVYGSQSFSVCVFFRRALWRLLVQNFHKYGTDGIKDQVPRVSPAAWKTLFINRQTRRKPLPALAQALLQFPAYKLRGPVIRRV